MPDRHPAAYIRRSSATEDNPGDASREAQLEAVRRLCGDDVTVYTDWGISGRKDDRPEYVKLKEAIAAGTVASVCAYSLSRLGRNARELLAFIELAGKHDVPVRTSVESIDTSTAMGRAMLTVMAAFAQLEVEQGMERSASARAARKARHDEAGVVMPPSLSPYGWKHVTTDGITHVVRDDAIDFAPIIAAYKQAGSVLAAVRLLNETGVPSPKGKRWGTSALTRVLERNAPELLPARSASGRRTPTRSLLGGLLTCHCGATLTPNVGRGQYYCNKGHVTGKGHGRIAIIERAILPFIKSEVARLQAPSRVVGEHDVAVRRQAIEERLERASELYIGQDISREKYEDEKARAKREMDSLDAADAVIDVPEVDWAWPPEQVNTVLRAMFHEVRLGPDLLPVEAVWRVPEWRA